VAFIVFSYERGYSSQSPPDGSQFTAPNRVVRSLKLVESFLAFDGRDPNIPLWVDPSDTRPRFLAMVLLRPYKDRADDFSNRSRATNCLRLYDRSVSVIEANAINSTPQRRKFETGRGTKGPVRVRKLNAGSA